MSAPTFYVRTLAHGSLGLVALGIAWTIVGAPDDPTLALFASAAGWTIAAALIYGIEALTLHARARKLRRATGNPRNVRT